MGSNVYKNTLIRIKYEQESPATTWTITHGLDTECPIVDIYVLHEGDYKKFWPLGVSVVDPATVEVTFTSATAGYATVM